MNSLPIPARHLVDKYEYGFLLGVKIVRGRATSIITSRGCAYRCSFCQIHKITPNYRSRSVLNITNEIVETVNSGYDTLFFVDDNFLAQKKKVEKVMDFIIQNEIDVDMWILGSRVDSADKNLYEKMRNAGVKFIGFGLESGNQHVLDYYNKNITLNQIREAVALSHEMGFITHGSFILGAPFETQKHFQQTINFAKSIPLNSAAFYTLGYPYGSSLWEKAVKDGKIRSDEHSVIANSDKDLGNFSTEELINYTLKANKSFFLTPKVWARLFFHMLSVKNFRFIKLALKMINPMGESKFNK